MNTYRDINVRVIASSSTTRTSSGSFTGAVTLIFGGKNVFKIPVGLAEANSFNGIGRVNGGVKCAGAGDDWLSYCPIMGVDEGPSDGFGGSAR